MDEKKKEVKENKTAEVKKQETKVEKAVKSEPEKNVKTKKEEKPKAEKKEENKKVETKKFETKKPDKKKKKTTWVATLVGVIVVLAIAALLTVMIVTSSDPKKSVDGLLTNLREGDFEKAQEFMSGEDLVNEGEFSAETQKLLFDKLTWKVTKVTKEGDNASVEIEVTNKDFKAIVTSYMQKALKAAFSGASEQEIETYFIEELKSEQVQTTTVTKTIETVKEDKKWKVVSNDELTDALLPGLQETINSLG